MTFPILSLVAVLIPFAVERYYFQKSGPFLILLILLLFQAGLPVVGEALSRSGLEAPDTILSAYAFLAGIAFLTVGFTPMIAVVLSAIALMLMVADKFSRRSERT